MPKVHVEIILDQSSQPKIMMVTIKILIIFIKKKQKKIC